MVGTILEQLKIVTIDLSCPNHGLVPFAKEARELKRNAKVPFLLENLRKYYILKRTKGLCTYYVRKKG